MIGVSIAGWLVACAGSKDPVEPEVVDPTEQGPYQVELVEGLTLDLGERGGGFVSTIPALLYVPVNASGDVPVVVFNHGFSAKPADYYSTLVHLSSWGFAVLAPEYDPGFTNPRTHQGLADDVTAVLNVLQTTAIETDVSLRLTDFGVGGHSRGGKQSLLAALTDTRIVATFNIDPVDSGPPFGEYDPADFPSVAPELVGALAIPAGLVGTGLGGTGEVPCAPVGENFQSYYDAIPADVYAAVLPDAGHNDLIDSCADGESGFLCMTCALGADPAATRTLERGLMTAFYLKHLVGDDRVDGWLDGTEVPGATFTVK